MPDLKQICKPCPSMDAELKPRKVICRLPDMDMWLICEDGKMKEAEKELSAMLEIAGITTSDVDPIRTIDDMQEIVDQLLSGKMPTKFLPVDAHIMEYSEMKDLIEGVPQEVMESAVLGDTPYLPIHPSSLRKTWQRDDEAYNYVYDFLAGFREYSFPAELQDALNRSRYEIASSYTESELLDILYRVSSPSQRARFENSTLKGLFVLKIASWRMLGSKDLPSNPNKQPILERED